MNLAEDVAPMGLKEDDDLNGAATVGHCSGSAW